MLFISIEKSGMINATRSSSFSMICLLELVINEVPCSKFALGLKTAVLDLSLILFIKSELLYRRFAPLSSSIISWSNPYNFLMALGQHHGLDHDIL